jgi:hypothetical protein
MFHVLLETNLKLSDYIWAVTELKAERPKFSLLTYFKQREAPNVNCPL